ncbi:hypothetical protein KV205_09795 [Streptomyces sp. SKN60]|uniref:hypothetical protein n=1 Tax=Streptomyces sp. SKN60 TaxID=2855506 RepID=UPI0022467863|nr:hypothetical protein [Streptomyces sp. SKN60]MCX2180819.1 hypothetical protein [Streptomyces sp. SKN60]
MNKTMNKTFRQFALALVACLAVAGGATIAATSGEADAPNDAPRLMLADDNWPVPTPAPGN